MKTKKSRLWKRSMALVLGFMMLLPSVALAEDTDASDNLPKTEAVQIDLNAEIEEALQEDSNLEDGPQVTIGGKEEDVSGNDSFESEKEISPRGVDYPVTELYIIGVRGASDGEKTSETVNCGKNIHIASDASKETRNFYDKSTALTITLQFYGTHLLSQKTTITGDIHMTGSHAIPRQAREQADFYYHTGLYFFLIIIVLQPVNTGRKHLSKQSHPAAGMFRSE